jgi:cellulose 1,4-beta-cellobiosidase
MVAAASGGYRVYRGGTQVGSTSSTSFTDTGLKTSGTYSYTVKAVGAGNKLSAASAAASVNYDIVAPKAVGAITAATPTATTPSLTWAAVTDTGGSGLRRYEVFRDGQSRGFTATASFLDTGAPDGSHSYTVVAEDAAGNRAPASAAKVVVVDSVPPTTPNAPQAASADTPTAPALSWSASTDAGTGVAGYRVLRDGAVVATTTATTYTDSNAAAGSHGYAIVAFDGVGNAATSPTTVVVYDPTPPALVERRQR